MTRTSLEVTVECRECKTTRTITYSLAGVEVGRRYHYGDRGFKGGKCENGPHRWHIPDDSIELKYYNGPADLPPLPAEAGGLRSLTTAELRAAFNGEDYPE